MNSLRFYTTTKIIKTNIFEKKVFEEISRLPKLNTFDKIIDNSLNIYNEKGGPRGLEPTRYSDWEQKGRCTDF